LKSSHKSIFIQGAREHNLKNITLHIPREKLIVITGLSGSGKSSLAFDTIYAEGQRRYVESLSTYARQFLGVMHKPDVDNIEGLSPAISIEQKTRSKNPRSTVGTITEIYDYLRLLFARIGKQKCPYCNQAIEKQSVQQIVDNVLKLPKSEKVLLMAPVVKMKKGTHKDLFKSFLQAGFIRAEVNNKIIDLTNPPILNKNKKHSINIVIDRLIISEKIYSRLTSSIELALNVGSGLLQIQDEKKNNYFFNEQLACLKCNISFQDLEPRFFSFNSPLGACEDCDGLGTMMQIDQDRIIPNDNISILQGALLPIGEPPWKNYYNDIFNQLSTLYKFDLSTPWKNLPQEVKKILLYGKKNVRKPSKKLLKGETSISFPGVIPRLQKRHLQTSSAYIREWIEKFMAIQNCKECHGKRLKKSSLSVYIKNHNIASLTELSIADLELFFQNILLTKKQQKISSNIIKEISSRLSFLNNVGLNYLTLNRKASTLSGGESQRIRLATQIGSQLVGVLYILDEPSIGLHARDNQKLINTLLDLKNLGNTVIVVEHDEHMMQAADWIIDIGLGAGVHGGNIIFEGSYSSIIKDKYSITGSYLAHKKKITIPPNRRKGNNKFISLFGASGNNLKSINVNFPLNKFICVTGVSGSGKSSLINQTLFPCLAKQYYLSKIKPLHFKKIDGLLYLDKVIDINQSPIGKTPRSNPSTYTGLFTHIRDLFSNVQDSKLHGYKAGRFSFNVKGGRCESCQGMGVVKVEMHFLPDVYIQCDQCHGKRFNRDTLKIKYRKKNISEVLNMSVEEAIIFFKNHNTIMRKLITLQKVGLNYIMLGQQATTLSGGESQRIKLAKELSKVNTGRTLYILDEPTTGLHFADIKLLLKVLHELTNKGNTILVIEHNLDVIKTADWIIDLGPEGGDKGGNIVAEGTPEQLSKNKSSYTGQYLKKILTKND